MWPFGQKAKAAVGELTFKSRVEDFWKWFGEVAPRFYAEIEGHRCPGLAEEVTENVHGRLGFEAWEFSGHPEKKGHCFTLTGDGNIHFQLLAQYWLERAPQIDGWTFYCAKQASGADNRPVGFEIDGAAFKPKEFWLLPRANEEQEKIDLAVWHPLLHRLPDDQKWLALFLILDQALGEYGTAQWIGEVTFNPAKLGDAIAISELADYVKRIEAERGWKKYPPGASTMVYTFKEPHVKFLRGDIIAGATTNRRLLEEFLAAEGEMEDPLRGTGADYVFAAFDVSILPKGSQVDARGKIEEEIEEALRAQKSGRLLGGALGVRNAYIDLLIFDGARSLEIVKQALMRHGLAGRAMIHFFAKDKRGFKTSV
jgi:hypothetical protein